jgi:lipopolysaccharide transport system ATP-binding protein
MLNADGEIRNSFSTGESITMRVQAFFRRDVSNPVVGILIRNRLGIDVYGTNTRIEQIEFGNFCAGEALELDFTLNCNLTRQEYTLTVAIQHWDGSSQDWLDDALQFTVMDNKDVAGLVNLQPAITWRRSQVKTPEFV